MEIIFRYFCIYIHIFIYLNDINILFLICLIFTVEIVFSINARSAVQNSNEFEIYFHLLSCQFSIIGITKTWFKDENSTLYGIDGYTIVENHRTVKSGGGVALCIKNNLQFSFLHDMNIFNETRESVFIEIEGHILNSKQNIIIGVVYRPPNQNIDEFIRHVEPILEEIQSKNKLAYILGDYNINILKYKKHSSTGNFLDLMYSNNFIPTITRPTRSISSTLIDNIYTNNIDDLMSTTHGILICDITDHFPVFNIIPAIEDRELDLYSYRRIIDFKNKQIFKDLVANANWENIFSYNDTQSPFTAFHSKLVKLYDQAFPKKRIKLTYRTKNPWLTEGLKISIKRKNVLYKLLVAPFTNMV